MKNRLLFALLIIGLLICLATAAGAASVTWSQNGSTDPIAHGTAITVSYDLSDRTYDHAELYAEAWYGDHYYTYPGAALSGTTGTYSWTNTGLGDRISFQVRLYEADGRWSETVFCPDPANYTGSWSNKPQVPALSVTYNQTAVTAGTPISANYRITGGTTGSYTRCEVNWTVKDSSGRYITSTGNFESPAAGVLAMDAPTVKGTHFVTATVEDGSGWTFQLEDRNAGIEVTTDRTGDPLAIQLTWTDENGNTLDPSRDKAVSGQWLRMDWTMSGGYTPYEGYLSIKDMNGTASFGSMGRRGASGSLEIPVWGNQDMTLQIEYNDTHGNSATVPVTIQIMAPLGIRAEYRQTHPQAGDTLYLDWSISGGSGSYTDVTVKWTAQESCLQKVMKTEHFQAGSGTASYTPGTSIDQVNAEITVTDSRGNTEKAWYWTQMENYQHVDEAWVSVENDMEYVQSGQKVSATWELGSGRFAISNVRYKWATRYRSGNGWGYEETGWTSAGNSLTGRGEYVTTQPGQTYMIIAFDADDGWACPGSSFDVIQVLGAGETPLTAQISITPAEPTTGDPVTIAWSTTGTTANTNVRVEWRFYGENGNSSSDTIIPTGATGSTALTFNGRGWLYAEIYVDDRDRELEFRRNAFADITEPSGITLTVTPAAPKLNEPVTVSWQIDRQNYTDAHLYVMLKSGNLYKPVAVNADLTANRSGSVTFTPADGDTLEAKVFLWNNHDFYSETTGNIPLQGTWNTVSPIQVNVTFQTQQPRGAGGTRITADYAITGGTGRYSYMRATWVLIDRYGSEILEEQELGQASGQIVYTPGKNGNYGLIFHVEDESGWIYDESMDDVQETITVTAAGGTERIILPRDLTAIETEAFQNVAAREFDIPDSVTAIGDNAFPEGSVLITGSGSYAWEWAEVNGYDHRAR